MRPITVSVGPGATTPAGSGMVRLDTWAGGNASVQCVASGTVNYTVQTSNDDPNDPVSPVAVGSMTWSASPDSLVVAATASQMSSLTSIPVFCRVLLNSGTGSVTMTVAQSGVVPY